MYIWTAPLNFLFEIKLMISVGAWTGGIIEYLHGQSVNHAEICRNLILHLARRRTLFYPHGIHVHLHVALII
jgi:hypothetical protein